MVVSKTSVVTIQFFLATDHWQPLITFFSMLKQKDPPRSAKGL
jgi:hypothetical protein